MATSLTVMIVASPVGDDPPKFTVNILHILTNLPLTTNLWDVLSVSAQLRLS